MMKTKFTNYIHDLQDRICEGLAKEDGAAKFEQDEWERPGGGGGKTRVIANGQVFEKGGVNTSVVYGQLPKQMQAKLNTTHKDFFACGISLVIHPENPMVPTVHANFRYFEMYDEAKNVVDQWFGGGLDLTPYYLFEEDARHFHQVIKNACDRHHPDFYPEFKKECDEYFFNTHRNEARGIGGIFYDYQRPGERLSLEELFAFAKEVGDAFLAAYLPIVKRRKSLSFTPENRYWQEIRRGRYVEFNLIHDRGTLFGLRTNGRTESILMSLPPRVRWDYDHRPESGTAEEKLLKGLKARNWV